jgi:hypothetical protein
LNALRRAWSRLRRRKLAEQFPSDDEVSEASRKYAGMTMNERLWEAGLMNEFEAAAAARDRDRMLLICARVGIADGPTGRSSIVDTVLANPARYGF